MLASRGGDPTHLDADDVWVLCEFLQDIAVEIDPTRLQCEYQQVNDTGPHAQSQLTTAGKL